MSDNVTNLLKEALTNSYDRGYARGRIDALKALSTSLHFVHGIKGVLSEEEKKGYKISIETVDATLKILEQDAEEKGL